MPDSPEEAKPVDLKILLKGDTKLSGPRPKISDTGEIMDSRPDSNEPKTKFNSYGEIIEDQPPEVPDSNH